jgi:hypothetical protein
MIFIAIATGVLSFLNYVWQANYPLSGLLQIISLIAQAALTAVTFAAMLRYRGKRSRASYDGGHYRVFTLRFGLIFLSMLGNIAVLVVLILHTSGIISSL